LLSTISFSGFDRMDNFLEKPIEIPPLCIARRWRWPNAWIFIGSPASQTTPQPQDGLKMK